MSPPEKSKKSSTTSSLFDGPKPDKIALAIGEAQEDPEAFENLLRLVEHTVRFLCRRFASQFQEDTYQAACIRMWRKIHLIDVSRPNTAKSYLMQAAISGIRDEVRRSRRGIYEKNMLEMDELKYTRGKDKTDKQPLNRAELPEILQRYLRYIEQTGDIYGAHKHVGMELGVSTARASTKFHEASKIYIEKVEHDKKISGDL